MTPNAAAPTPGEQGVAMEQGKQQHQPPPPSQPQPQQEKRGSRDDDMHKTTGYVRTSTLRFWRERLRAPDLTVASACSRVCRDVMTHSFGEGYSTRSDEEGFGGVYGQNDPVFNPGTEVHPSHPGTCTAAR